MSILSILFPMMVPLNSLYNLAVENKLQSLCPENTVKPVAYFSLGTTSICTTEDVRAAGTGS